MNIHVHTGGGDFIPRHFASLDHIKMELNLDEINNEDDFHRKIRKGEHIFCYICPYNLEVEREKVLKWELTLTKAKSAFYLLQENL